MRELIQRAWWLVRQRKRSRIAPEPPTELAWLHDTDLPMQALVEPLGRKINVKHPGGRPAKIAVRIARKIPVKVLGLARRLVIVNVKRKQG